MAQIDIHPRISVSGISSMGWSLDQDIDFYRSAGIETVGILCAKLQADINAGVRAIQDAHLRCSCVVAGQMGASLIGRTDQGEYTALEVLRPGIDLASALGGPPCYFTSGATPARMPTDDAYIALVEALGSVTAYAQSQAVYLAIENNSTATRDNGFIHTLQDAVDLACDTGIGVCLELQNCWMERRLPELFKRHVERFVVVQVSDFMVGEAARLNRRVPGDGVMPLEWMLGHLLDAGYGGLFEIEVLGPKIEEEGYPAAILRSVEWLSNRLRAWGV